MTTSCLFIPMVGKKYGRLTVLAEAGGRYAPSGSYCRLILVRCDCGAEYTTSAPAVRNHVWQCAPCGKAFNTERGKRLASVRLPSGRTIAQIADAVGLKLDTVYARWRRGWPEEDLGRRRSLRKDHKGGSVRSRPAVTLTTTT